MKRRGYYFPAFLFFLFGFVATTAWSQTNAPSPAPSTAPTADAGTPPPSAPPTLSQADLEKLVAPIALYPDPLIATLLPASAYPLEIVQAARFVQDTNNIAKLDAQKWDDNVKEVARIPEVIKQMNENIEWTSDLGNAFINQPKEIMDAIQTMRTKAQESGALKTTPQQTVVTTNMVVTNTVEQEVVYVTNQVVQIQPAQPEVIYVPQYNPTVVYSGYPVSYPGYYYPPAPAYYPGGALLSFGVGMATGAIIANNCDWGHGGSYHGSYHSDVDVNVDRNVNANVNRSANANVNRGQKWQPDQNRLRNSGSTTSSAQSREARGWSSPSEASQAASSARSQNVNRPSSASANRPSTANADRPSSQGNRPSSSQASRPSSSSGASRQNINQPAGADRPSNVSRPSPSSSSQRSAFSGGSASQTRAASSRGASSRGGGGGGGRGGGRR